MGQDLERLIGTALSRVPRLRRVIIASSGGFARRLGYLDRLAAIIGQHGEIVRFDDVQADPTIEDAASFAACVEAHAPELVVALGGGSVIDTVKVGCAFAGVAGPIEAKLREGRAAVPRRAMRVIAIPTTAGTGSEVTPYAVLRGADERHVFGASEHLFADEGILWTPLYTTVPREIIRDVAFDALTHALEALWARGASPYSDTFAHQAMLRIHKWLRPYHADPTNADAAGEMAIAASMAGLAFAAAFTTACHGLSFPIAERLGLSHGRACAALITAVAHANSAICRPEIDAMVRSLGLSDAADLPHYLARLRADLGDADTLSSLSARPSLMAADVEDILSHTQAAMLRNNRLPLKRQALEKILADAWR